MDSQTNDIDIAKTVEKLENIECGKTLEDIMSSLPRRNGSYFSRSFYQYQGHWYHQFFIEGIILAHKHFKPQPGDVIVCSAPKTGTTWLKSLTFAVMTRSSFNDSNSPLLTKIVHDCVPVLEFDSIHPSRIPDNRSNIPLFSTHMPYSSLPKSIKHQSNCKLVYICRNPKDTFVSMHHFAARHSDEVINSQAISLDEAFELFCEGVTQFGPYWDHVLGFWRASLERPDKVLFLKYEEIRRDTVSYVKKLAEFIGYPFSSEEEEKGLVEKIVHLCSFDNLSNLEVNRNGKVGEGTPFKMENKNFFRKGKVGDWENYLTPEMAARLDQITSQKLQGLGLIL